MYIDRTVHQQLTSFFDDIMGGWLVVEKGQFVYRGMVDYYDNSIDHVLMLACRSGTFENRLRQRYGECEFDFVVDEVRFGDDLLELSSQSDGTARLFFKKNIQGLSPTMRMKIGNAMLAAA